MKFNQSLKFNVVPDWYDYYINYDVLKKLIYNLQEKQLEVDQLAFESFCSETISGLYEKEKLKGSKDTSNMFKKKKKDEEAGKGQEKNDVVESSHEVSATSSFVELKSDKKNFNPLVEFANRLLAELETVDRFFISKNEEFSKDFVDLLHDLKSIHDVNEMFAFTKIYNVKKEDVAADKHHQYHIKSTLSRTTTNASVFDTVNHIGDDMDKNNEIDDSDDEDDYESTVLVDPIHFDLRKQRLITLKQKVKNSFFQFNELKSYVELNKLGFTKITKKFDKNFLYSIKADFIENFLPAHSTAFKPQQLDSINEKIDQLANAFAYLSLQLDSSKTIESTKFELDNLLRDHIIWERNTVWKDLLTLEKRNNSLTSDTDYLHIKFKNTSLFGKSIPIPASFLTSQIIKLFIAIVAFVILMCVPTLNDPVQHRSLAVLAVCAILWASEALPLYTTSMFIPLLIVSCRILKNSDGTVMSGPDASKLILSSMWSSVIMVLIGGFTLAAALSKYNVAKVVSSFILSVAGTKPRNILLTIMFISLFLAMWISNVAAPVLCYSLVQPVLKTIPSHSAFAKALILGIALASNMAGMASPIASPQNVIAIEAMSPNPGWGNWFAVALPVSIIGTVLIWLELIFTFDVNDVKIKPFKPIRDRFTIKQIYISAVTIATILLWCTLSKTEGTFGEAGIISCIPIVLFYGTGLLKADDLNNYPWSIVLLAMGGLALGKGITSSGLLSTIAMALQKKIIDFNVWVVLIIFGLLILVIATFVSHTVAALIIIPLVKEIGDTLPGDHANLLIMGTALLASGAMGLPTSGFPNVTAISMTDEMGKPYLTVNLFIMRGVPASILAYIVVITVGYGIMNAIHF